MKTSFSCLLGTFLFATSSLTSCAVDDPCFSDESPYSNNAISFETYVKTNSRASIVQNTALRDGFGVLGYSAKPSATRSAPEKPTHPNFMNNQKISYAANSWTYSPVKYWPEDDTKITFLGYGPYDKASRSVHYDPNPQIEYNIANAETIDLDNMYDLVLAQQADKDGSDGKTVNLQFNHTLSRIALKLKTNAVYYDQNNPSLKTYIIIKDIKLGGDKFYTSGNIDLETATWIEDDLVAAPTAVSIANMLNTSNTTINTAYSRDGIQLGTTTDAVNAFADNDYLFLIPNSNVADGDFTVMFDVDVVTVDPNIAGGIVLQSFTKTVNLDTDFNQGSAYTLTFNFALDAISFNAKVVDWVDTTVF